MVALVIGTLLAVGALAFVLYPVFFGVPRQATTALPARRIERPTEDAPIVALREIEFDRATGKLSEPDYVELKTRYTREAIQAMRRAGSGSSGSSSVSAGVGVVTDDEVEAAVRAYRARRTAALGASANACPTCGPRPEPDAVFCSSCGRYLAEWCAGCGAPVVEPDARFCTSCGQSLAA
jgi:hypothetical protein